VEPHTILITLDPVVLPTSSKLISAELRGLRAEASPPPVPLATARRAGPTVAHPCPALSWFTRSEETRDDHIEMVDSFE
jgi:hypothetical protein